MSLSSNTAYEILGAEVLICSFNSSKNLVTMKFPRFSTMEPATLLKSLKTTMTQPPNTTVTDTEFPPPSPNYSSLPIINADKTTFIIHAMLQSKATIVIDWTKKLLACYKGKRVLVYSIRATDRSSELLANAIIDHAKKNNYDKVSFADQMDKLNTKLQAVKIPARDAASSPTSSTEKSTTEKKPASCVSSEQSTQDMPSPTNSTATDQKSFSDTRTGPLIVTNQDIQSSPTTTTQKKKDLDKNKMNMFAEDINKRIIKCIIAREENLRRANFPSDSLYKMFIVDDINYEEMAMPASLSKMVPEFRNGIGHLRSHDGAITMLGNLLISEYTKQKRDLTILSNNGPFTMECKAIMEKNRTAFNKFKKNEAHKERSHHPAKSIKNSKKGDLHVHNGGSFREEVVTETSNFYLNCNVIVYQAPNGNKYDFRGVLDLQNINYETITSAGTTCDKTALKNFHVFNQNFNLLENELICEVMTTKTGPLEGRILATMMKKEHNMRDTESTLSEVRVTVNGKLKTEVLNLARFEEESSVQKQCQILYPGSKKNEQEHCWWHSWKFQ